MNEDTPFVKTTDWLNTSEWLPVDLVTSFIELSTVHPPWLRQKLPEISLLHDHTIDPCISTIFFLNIIMSNSSSSSSYDHTSRPTFQDRGKIAHVFLDQDKNSKLDMYKYRHYLRVIRSWGEHLCTDAQYVSEGWTCHRKCLNSGSTLGVGKQAFITI